MRIRHPRWWGVTAARALVLSMSSMLLVVAGLLSTTHLPAQDPVYSVAQLQAGLADHPQTWVGRTVRVRGMAEPCPWRGGTARLWQCADEPLILVADPTDRMAEPLPLSQVTAGGILAVLRGLPLLHDLVAPPLAVPAFRPARFQVQVHSIAALSCGGRSPCYAAMLLGAAS